MESHKNRKLPHFLEFSYRTVRKFESRDSLVDTGIQEILKNSMGILKNEASTKKYEANFRAWH